jgi:hypothetical protein
MRGQTSVFSNQRRDIRQTCRPTEPGRRLSAIRQSQDVEKKHLAQQAKRLHTKELK